MNKSSPIPEFRVLIVEDDSATRLLLKKVVTKAGYFTDEASSAEVALELIQKNKYHIVVTDIGLPGQDGLELLQEIKKIPAGNTRREIFFSSRKPAVSCQLGPWLKLHFQIQLLSDFLYQYRLS